MNIRSYSYLSASIGSSRAAFRAGIETEKDPDRRREQKAAGNRRNGYRRRPAGDHRNRNGEQHADDDATNTAAHAQEDGFSKKLEQYVRATGTNRHPQADFARTLRHRHQQNIHYPDAADEK